MYQSTHLLANKNMSDSSMKIKEYKLRDIKYLTKVLFASTL